jgi:phosphatidate cytidylyltransferase
MMDRAQADSDRSQDADLAEKSRAPSKFVDLAPRVVSAVALIAAALAALVLGGYAFVLFWLVAAFAVFWEWQTLIAAEHYVERNSAGALTLAAAAFAAHAGRLDIAIGSIFLLAALTAGLAGRSHRLWASAGAVYAGALIVSVISLRQSPELGLVAVGWLFAVVWGTDILAYFGGRLIGGPKLWPRVSAGKTWSGTITGLVCGAALGVVVARFDAEAAPFPVALVSLFASAFSQLGDLAESAVKRHFGVKDSSQLIPGHGGVMDRLDGFIFACAFAAAFGALRDAASAAAGLFLW